MGLDNFLKLFQNIHKDMQSKYQMWRKGRKVSRVGKYYKHLYSLNTPSVWKCTSRTTDVVRVVCPSNDSCESKVFFPGKTEHQACKADDWVTKLYRQVFKSLERIFGAKCSLSSRVSLRMPSRLASFMSPDFDKKVRVISMFSRMSHDEKEKKVDITVRTVRLEQF
jgi:hypothetical protein